MGFTSEDISEILQSSLSTQKEKHMNSEELSERSYSDKEDENYCISREKEYSDTKSQERFDHAFIKKNFCPVKLSRADIKHLSSDFEDQTLGGHRDYREEIIDGRLAKVYVYKIKIIKYENEILEIRQNSETDNYNPLIIVENNLIVPFNQNLIINKPIQTTKSPVISPYEGVEPPIAKRGRPRKYPKGEEPYKLRKKAGSRFHDDIPQKYNYSHQNSNIFSDRPIDSKSMFNFDNDYERYNSEYNFNTNQTQDIPNPFLSEFSSSPNSKRYEASPSRFNRENNEQSAYNKSFSRNMNIDNFLNEYINSDDQNNSKRKENNEYKKEYSTEFF